MTSPAPGLEGRGPRVGPLARDSRPGRFLALVLLLPGGLLIGIGIMLALSGAGLLSEPAPRSTSTDLRYCSATDPISHGHRCSSFAREQCRTDSPNRIFGQDGYPILLAPRTSLRTGVDSAPGSALDGHVSLILGLRAGEHVVRIAAGRVVAAVASAGLVGWHWLSSGKHPGEHVSLNDTRSIPEGSVPVTASSSQPGPAFVRATTVDLRPESRNEFFRCSLASSHLAPPVPVVRDRSGVRAPAGPDYFSTAPCGCGERDA